MKIWAVGNLAIASHIAIKRQEIVTEPSLSLGCFVPLDIDIVVKSVDVIGMEIDSGFPHLAVNPIDSRPATTLVVAVKVSTWSMDVALRRGVLVKSVACVLVATPWAMIEGLDGEYASYEKVAGLPGGGVDECCIKYCLSAFVPCLLSSSPSSMADHH